MFVPFVWCRATGTAWLALSAVLVSGTAHAQSVDPDLRNPILVAAAADSSGYDLGYRDGYHQQPYRDKDRSNAAYADGYKAGEARRKGGEDAGSDYDTGYRDGLSQLPYRDRDRSNKAYGNGYRAGEAHRRAGGVTSGGSAYDQGFRDGYTKQPYRDKDRSNQAYGNGFRAGEAQRQQNAGGVAPPVAAAGSADYENGFRDALNKQPSRDRDRSNKSYAAGYKAGGARSAAIAAGGADYELGFRDAFNKAEYRDRDRNNKRYAEGFKAGQLERDGSAAVAARPGTGPVTRIEDLLGRRGADVDGAMKALGYSNRGGLGEGRQSVTTWRGTSNDDCVRIVVREGTVKTTRRIDETSCR
jgi:hypothetical protein